MITDRELDIEILEIRRRNEELIHEYLQSVQRKRKAQEQEVSVATQAGPEAPSAEAYTQEASPVEGPPAETA